MIALSLSSFRSGPDLWYINRASGIAVLVLLTISVIGGIIGARTAAGGWVPVFASQRLHRNLSLLCVAFVAIHALSAILDTYVSIPWWQMFSPFFDSYKPVWLGFGALAFDLMLALAITSVLRHRLSPKVWRAIHWLGYAVWPVAVVHGWGIGTDSGQAWAHDTVVFCGLAILLALVARLAERRRAIPRPTGRG